MNAARLLPALTLLDDGRVLLVSGHSLTSAEVYNPDANVWTVATSASAVHRSATATVLADGTVLIAGGRAATATDVAERYQP